MIALTLYHCSREVKSRYEDTIMKTTVKMTLVKPAINGMEPDTPLCSEPV
jgi:dynein heavy chain